MIKRTFLALLSIFAAVVVVQAAEIKWFKGDLNKALELAKKENKIVMIDFFTDWCSPCKILDELVWQDEEVVSELKKMSLIPMKLDAEKEGAEAAKKYSIKAYPTILFLNKNGDEIGRKVGFGKKEDILKALRKNCKETRSIKDLKGNYAKNPDNLEVALTLAQKLLKTEEKKNIEEANDLLEKIYRADPENKQGFGGQALIEKTLQGFRELFDELYSFRIMKSFRQKNKGITLLWDDEPLDFSDVHKSLEFLYSGAMQTKAPMVNSALNNVYEKIKSLNIKPTTFDFKAIMSLYHALYGKEWREAQNTLVDIGILFSEYASANDLNTLAWHNYENQRRLNESLTLSQKSCQMENNPNYLDTEAHLLMSLGQKEKAIELEKKAIDDLKKKGDIEQQERFRDTLKTFENNQLDSLAPGVEPFDKNLKKAKVTESIMLPAI